MFTGNYEFILQLSVKKLFWLKSFLFSRFKSHLNLYTMLKQGSHIFKWLKYMYYTV